MARPTRDEAELLECLREAGTHLVYVVDMVDVLVLRFQQIERRVAGHYLQRIVRPGLGQARELAEEVDAVRRSVRKALAMLEEGRQQGQREMHNEQCTRHK